MVFLLPSFEPNRERDTLMKIMVINMIAMTQWVKNSCHLLCAYYVLRIMRSISLYFHLIPPKCPVMEVLILSIYREDKWAIERLSNLPKVIELTSGKFWDLDTACFPHQINGLSVTSTLYQPKVAECKALKCFLIYKALAHTESKVPEFISPKKWYWEKI